MEVRRTPRGWHGFRHFLCLLLGFFFVALQATLQGGPAKCEVFHRITHALRAGRWNEFNCRLCQFGQMTSLSSALEARRGSRFKLQTFQKADQEMVEPHLTSMYMYIYIYLII